MADILEIKRALATRAQSVAEHLLPAGRRDGQEWRAGSIAGEKGQSLGVHLSGDKAGIWSDFTTGESGDLLDLWRAVRGVSLSEALDQAGAWCGMTRPEPYNRPTPDYVRPAKPRAVKPEGRVLDYLRADRNLPEATIAAYRVGADGDSMIFPFLLPDGVLALAKARKAEDGAKPKPTAANCEPVLFGWQAVPPDAREIIITEGEIDAMSWHAYGHSAMSVPFGGGKGAKQNWIENDYDRMERFERIYISTDMDQVGDEAAEEIANRLGRHRCLRVRLPRKDANECLVEGVTDADMAKCLATASSLDPAGLKRASAFLDGVTRLFWPEADERQGYVMPYGRLGSKLQFRPAELTLWSGSSGAGKSQVLSDCTVDWVRQGSRICIASLEMKPVHTLKRMVKQAAGLDRPTPEFIGDVIRWLDGGLLIYDLVGKSGIEPLLQVFDYARAKYGCDQFIIDSLMRLGISGDDYNGQEKAVFQMVDWAIRSNVHLHLVAHARKGEQGRNVPEIDDVKGAMEIGANAANIITIWRNRRHEEEASAAKTDAQRAEINEKPGVVLNVAKQRNGDFEGKCGLWFDQETYRYRDAAHVDQWGRSYVHRIERERGAA